MHDFMKTILLALKEWVNKRIKNNTPNWNENNPEADGYIKNRPFYRDETKTETVVRTTSFITPSPYWWDVPFVFIPIVGETYKITFDGEEYICAAYLDQYGGKCVGNLAVGNDGYPGDTGEPFFYYWYDSEDYGACIRDQGEHTIAIEKINVTKIDELYLPSNLAKTEELLALNGYVSDLEYQVNNKVSYMPQNFDASSKKIARNNIDAVSTEEAIIYKNTHEETVTWNGNTANATTMQFNGLTYYLLPEAPIYSFDQLATNSVQATLSNGTIKTHTAYEGVNKCYSLGTSAETIVVVEVPKTSCSLPNYYGSSRSTVFVPKVAGVYTRRSSPYWTSFTYSVKDSGTNIYMPTYETGTKFPVKLNENGTFFEEHIPNTIARTSEIPSTEGLATETYVNTKVASLVDSAPETLDTLNELAAALGDDPNFATTITTKLGELETAVNNFEIPNSNLVNGNTEDSLRMIGSCEESNDYVMGESALALGIITRAEGDGSVSEGMATIANGLESHAAGFRTYAGGDYSYAGGNYSSATAEAAYAVGTEACAHGRSSHAEGQGTVVEASFGHVEGIGTVVIGEAAHSEGESTFAEEDSSHTEGRYTSARGIAAHAEGYGEYVWLDITGEANTLTYTYEVYEGSDTDIYPGASIRAYTVDVLRDADSYTDLKYRTTHYKVARVVSVNTSAKTITLNKTLSSVALDEVSADVFIGTVAHGDASHAEGYSTIAGGFAQHVEGSLNAIDPSFDPDDTENHGKYLHITGNGTEINDRSNAHALDWNGNAYYAGDVYVAGDGKNDFAGSKKLATEDFVAGAVSNFEIPNSNLVNGSAEGSLRTIRSMQEDSNYTMGPHAFAEGDSTMAEGNSSHAEGYNTKAFGETCHVEGNSTSADGSCSHAEGYMSSVEGFGSHAEGFATCAYGRGQHVEGEFNIPDEVDEVRDRGQYLHIAGNGSWDNQIESNAYTLDWSGNAWFSGDVYVGSTSGTNKDEGSKKLATEDFVTAALTALGLPVPTAADAGKILRVNAQGKYELVAIANAEEATF